MLYLCFNLKLKYRLSLNKFIIFPYLWKIYKKHLEDMEYSSFVVLVQSTVRSCPKILPPLLSVFHHTLSFPLFFLCSYLTNIKDLLCACLQRNNGGFTVVKSGSGTS